LEALSALWHDHSVLFGPDAPFAVDGKAVLRQGFQALFANSESITAMNINPQYRVIGDTEIVWTHCALAIKPKGGPLQNRFFRVTTTCARAEGKWLSVAVDISTIPSEN